MPEYQKHLYMIVFPINALVASQLKPKDFGVHYITGGAKHFSGKMIFAELDINFRNEEFEIDKYLEATVPHEDGSPKKTPSRDTIRTSASYLLRNFAGFSLSVICPLLFSTND